MAGITEEAVLAGFITVPEEEVQVILDHLPDHVALILAESGCVVFVVTQRLSEPNIFDVYEESQDGKAFAKHPKRVQESPWGRVTKNVLPSYTVTGL
jgi:quinol monooxygenase YgiN